MKMDISNKLTKRIVLALIYAIVVGTILHFFSENFYIQKYITNGILFLISEIFISSMKMLVIPLIFISIICGVSNLSDPRKLGTIGGKTVLLYLFTTSIAISIAILISILFEIGSGANLALPSHSISTQEPQTFTETIIGLFPQNPINALSEGKILQVIVFSILFGFALSLSGTSGKRIKDWFIDMNKVIMSLVNIALYIAPIGIFALVSKLVISITPDKIVHIFSYFGTVLLVLIIHLLFTNSIILLVIGKLKPFVFLKKMFPTMLFAFSTSSSNATIPLTLTTVNNKIGVNNKICSFTIPLGATVNMDGTAIMQGVATIFIANLYNINLDITQYFIIIATATLSSIGTAGIPGIGLITLTIVLQQVGLPIEGIALIIGIDRLLDMVRTAVNVTGDATITTVIAKTESLLDIDQYYKKP